MSTPPDLTPTTKTARQFVFEFLKVRDNRGPDSQENALAHVRHLRGFLDPAKYLDPALVDSPPCPAGTGAPKNVGDLAYGALLTQKAPEPGHQPAYSFPLPGQPVSFRGSPTNFQVPDGSLYDATTDRWECEDARVIALSPLGPVAMTVDSGEFEPWTPDSPQWSEMLDECRRILAELAQDLEGPILAKGLTP